KLEVSAPPRELADALVGLGDAQLLAGKPDHAANAYRRAVALDAADVRGNLGLGKALYQQKDFAAASDALSKAIDRDAHLAEAYYWFAASELERRHKSAAHWGLVEYLRLAPRGELAASARKMLKQAR